MTQLDCNELVELLSAFLDGSLDDATRGQVEDHLALCEGCTTYLQQFRQAIEALGHVSGEDLPSGLRERLMGAFRELPGQET